MGCISFWLFWFQRRQELSVVGYANTHVQGGGILELDSSLKTSKSLYEGNTSHRAPALVPPPPAPHLGNATGGIRSPNTYIEEVMCLVFHYRA